MIDVESQVYAAVSKAVKKKFPKAFTSGEYTDTPAKFPAVTVTESDNTVLKRLRTNDQLENAVSVMYEVNIYTNTVGYKKLEAKEILSVVDDEMEGSGFTRTYCSPIANIQDATIYRIVARYEGVVDRDHWVYTG